MRDIIVEVTTTTDSEEEANRIAGAAVERKLAACAQITGPIVSHYTWKEKQFQEKEWRISLKTLKTLESDLMNLIAELHLYENPELTSVRLENVSEAYLEWILHSLGK